MDALLLAVGKALYLANAFELKCIELRRLTKLVDAFTSDPVQSLQDAIAGLPSDQMLGRTLFDLGRNPYIGSQRAALEVLNKAREARNFIAHGGVLVGPIDSVTERQAHDVAATLRVAVLDLAAGDNVVSSWLYEIEEKMPAPKSVVSQYLEIVERWVFKDLHSLVDLT